MKNVKLPVLGLSLVLLMASCKKNDYKEASATDATTATASSEADSLGWKTSSTWENADQGSFSVHYFTIQDSAITSDVADNGMVLVFKKNGTAVNALPFEEATSVAQTATEKTTNANYWYHQVSTGSLLISCDLYKAAATPDNANSFKYFVLTPEKLQSLETSGYTAEKLMNLSYSAAASLLKSGN